MVPGEEVGVHQAVEGATLNYRPTKRAAAAVGVVVEMASYDYRVVREVVGVEVEAPEEGELEANEEE